MTDFPRQFPSPGYSYYTRSQEYCVTQEQGDKDMETRYSHHIDIRRKLQLILCVNSDLV